MEYVNYEVPKPNYFYDIVNVKCIGVNFADTHQTEDTYISKQKLPFIPGAEVAGINSKGKRVVAIASSGAYAEKVHTFKNLTIEIPDNIEFEESVALMIQGTTAWNLLHNLGNVKNGNSVLIHSGSSGVGVMAIQIAKLAGAKVTTTVSNKEKEELVKELGADFIIESSLIKENIKQNEYDIVLNMSGENLDNDLYSLKPFGKLIVYGIASRKPPMPINPAQLLAESKAIMGFWLNHSFENIDLFKETLNNLFNLVLNKQIKVIIKNRYSLKDARLAHLDILNRITVGKVILTTEESNE
jgi:NADPH2:quinone reductase